MNTVFERVIEKPGDRATLRVYADSLLEAGDVLGEYLQLSLAQDACTPFDATWDRLKWRLRELERAHRGQWLKRFWGASPMQYEEPAFFRGLPSAMSFWQYGMTVFDQVPVASIRLQGQKPSDLKAFATIPVVKGLVRLEVDDTADPAGYGALLASGVLTSLEEVVLPWSVGRSLEWLEAMPGCSKLEVLSLRVMTGEAPVTGAQWARLGALKLPALKRLELSGLTLGTEGAEVLAASKWRPSQLVLERAGLSAAGAKVLFKSPLMAELGTLSLTGTELSPKAIEALTQTAMPKLVSLDLAGTGLGKHVARVGEVTAWPSLRRMVLSSNAVRAEGLKALNSAALGKQLVTLELAHCHLKDDGAAVLGDAAGFKALQSLELAGNSFTKEGMEALAKAPVLARLERLGLAHNKFQTEGGKALATAKNLSKLRVLALAHNWLGSLGLRALLANESLTALEEIEEGLNNYGPELWRSFVKFEHLPLKRLVATGEVLEADVLKVVASPRVASLDELLLPTELTDAMIDAMIDSAALRSAKTVLVVSKNALAELVDRLRAAYQDRVMTY